MDPHCGGGVEPLYGASPDCMGGGGGEAWDLRMVSKCLGNPSPLWTGTCENITFPVIWMRAVIRQYSCVTAGAWRGIMELHCTEDAGDNNK